jgi:hypothetical protein
MIKSILGVNIRGEDDECEKDMLNSLNDYVSDIWIANFSDE